MYIRKINNNWFIMVRKNLTIHKGKDLNEVLTKAFNTIK